MKRWLSCVFALILILTFALPASAAESNVIYDGNAGKFIFPADGDLFPNLKNVMPGDTLTQTIVVKNENSKGVKVELFLQSLGTSEEMREFLSQLQLKVEKVSGNVLFDAPADLTAGLSGFVSLGILYPGGSCELLVTLTVPGELDNRYQNLSGTITWEFKVEERPDPPMPTNPPTVPTAPTEPPTQPPTEPTESTEPPTEPPTEPTEPPAEPTKPTEPTARPTEPTEPTTPSQPTSGGNGNGSKKCCCCLWWLLLLLLLILLILFILFKRKKDEEEETTDKSASETAGENREETERDKGSTEQ